MASTPEVFTDLVGYMNYWQTDDNGNVWHPGRDFFQNSQVIWCRKAGKLVVDREHYWYMFKEPSDRYLRRGAQPLYDDSDRLNVWPLIESL